jgi:D-alanyl-D-alanine carboxypeptidase-like protein
MGNFYSDVIQPDSRFDSVNRVADPLLLEPATRQLVQQIVDAAQQMGISVMIFETYRSQARQEQLFNNGATKLRTVGVHRYGLACDIVREVGGEPSWKGDFSFLGELAHSSGLIWGGDWGNPNIKHTFIDAVHVQRCTIARQPALFAGTWYPDDAYNPYTDDPHLLFTAAAQPPKPGPALAASKPGISRPRKKRA